MTQHPSLRALLKRIGLQDREAEVYLAILTLKSARASAVADLARQSRSHTYLVLKALMERGLVSRIERAKVLHFVAEPPEHLLAYLDDRSQELQELSRLAQGALPQFKQLTRTTVEAPRVTLLHGIEGMKQVYREIFPNAFCALFNPETMYQAFGKGIPQLILKNNQSLRGRDLLVDNAASKRFMRENPQNAEYEIRLLPKGTAFATDTMAFGNVVVIVTYDADHTIIRIENANLADSFRAWFEILWAGARPQP